MILATTTRRSVTVLVPTNAWRPIWATEQPEFCSPPAVGADSAALSRYGAEKASETFGKQRLTDMQILYIFHASLSERKVAVTSINIDAKMDKTLEDLKFHFGASSKAEVIRKAVALLNVAKNAEQPDGSVVIMSSRGVELRVVVK